MANLARLVFICKIYISVILSVFNHLCRIYYTVKKEFKCVIVVKKEKDVISDKNKIYVYSNMSKKSI